MSDKNENIKKLSEALHKSYIHYDPNRTIYAITEQELLTIDTFSSNIWKDIGIASIGIGIPCLINAISIYNSLSKNNTTGINFTLDIFLNGLFGMTGLILGIILLIIFKFQNKKKRNIIESIKDREKFEIPNQG